jgi:hypothetical protein
MYRFSRSIYRELAPRIHGDVVERSDARNHVLEASEATLRRLATDRRHFARPTEKLFGEIRSHFALAEQVRVYVVIARNLDLAIEFLDNLPEGVTFDGRPRRCPASTRQGTSCRREPRPGRDYCPSHRHLEEAFDSFEELLETPQEQTGVAS